FTGHQGTSGQPHDPSNSYQCDHPQHADSSLCWRRFSGLMPSRTSGGIRRAQPEARRFHRITTVVQPYLVCACCMPARNCSTLILSTSETPVSTKRGNGEKESVA